MSTEGKSFDPQATAQFHTDLHTGALKERDYKLVVVDGVDKGKEVLLTKGVAMLGTHANNDLVLSDDTISRYHAELTVSAAGLRIKDLDSTNGTFHGGTRLGAVTINGPARIRLGKRTDIDIRPVDTDVSLGDYQDDHFGNAFGASATMRRLFSLLSRVSPTDATILLEGETGTGKEVIAEAIHLNSPRKDNSLVVVDCAAIPENLIGSELFGHMKGAFTGAQADKRGLIEAADGGTLFLDEIGELSIDLQPQLLRALERREVRRIGDTKVRNVDIRVIAATNRDLQQMVKEGTFREDLYYRLAVVKTRVPPLRERVDDIALLATRFADKITGRGYELSPTLIEQLKKHKWPGNVRELRNVVERALSLGQVGMGPSSGLVGTIGGVRQEPAHYADGNREEVLDMPFKEAKGQLIETFERDYITHLLEKHNGNISRAAQDAGIDRNYIHRLVKKYGLTVERG